MSLVKNALNADKHFGKTSQLVGVKKWLNLPKKECMEILRKYKKETGISFDNFTPDTPQSRKNFYAFTKWYNSLKQKP